MVSPQSALDTHLCLDAAVAHRNLALYHSNVLVALSSQAVLLPLHAPVANNATNNGQQTEPLEEMLLSEHTLEMLSRMKDMNLAKLDKRISDLYRLLTSCASPLSQEGLLLGALVESEDDKCKRAFLQDILPLIMLGDRHLCDPEALDDALFMVVADQKYDSLWRSRFHNSFCEYRRAEHAAVEEQNENTLTEECEECGDRC